MKFLCLLFAVAIFCGVQADDPGLDQETKQEALQTLAEFQDDDEAVRAAYDNAVQDVRDKGLKEEAQFRGYRQPCFFRRGYCLPRKYICFSGYVFKEQFNTCRGKRNKCCLA